MGFLQRLLLRTDDTEGQRPTRGADVRVTASSSGSSRAENRDLWGETAERRASDPTWTAGFWHSHPLTAAHIRRRVTGNADRDWRELLRDYVPVPVPRALVLGCGGGEDALVLLRRGLAEEVVGVDASARAIEVASEAAARSGFSGRAIFKVVNLDTETLSGRFPLVVASHCIHHVTNLEGLFDGIHAVLEPGGILAADEYVGPSRFQWTEQVERYMNRLLDALPERYRREGPDGQLRGGLRRASPETVIAVDPSEAVRSAEILPLLERRFEVLLRRDYGGTLLQWVLAGIIANFDPEKDTDRALVDLLVAFEEELVDAGVIPSDFAFVVARPRSEGAR